jgi:hypothetical protein
MGVQHIRSQQGRMMYRRDSHVSPAVKKTSSRIGFARDEHSSSASKRLIRSAIFSGLLLAIVSGIFGPTFTTVPSHIWQPLFWTPVNTAAIWDNYNNILQQESRAIDQILEDSFQISVRATKADMVTVDIIQALRNSNLRSRELLADTLIDFARGGYTIAEDLQVLDKKVTGVVDR